jgi:hypothetical protein
LEGLHIGGYWTRIVIGILMEIVINFINKIA